MAKPYLRNNMWYSNFRVDGKRIRKPLSPNKREAENILHEMIASARTIKNGMVPQNLRWQTFEEKYKQYCATDKAEQTAYRDDLAFRMMKNSLPIVYLNQVTPDALETLKFKWQEAGKTLSTITRAVKSIKTAMRKAEQWGYVAKQDWRIVKVKEPKGRLRYFSVEELQNLIDACTGRWKTAVILCGRNGLRSGEAWSLTWEDVRFDLHKIHICAKEGWHPKGHKEGWVRMGADTEAYLQSLPRRQGFVLGPDRPTIGSFQAYLARLIRNAGLTGSPHTLRHTFASHLAIAGVSMPKIAELLRHSSVKTAEIYSHLSPESLEEAVNRLPVVRLWPVVATSSGMKRNEKERKARR